MSIKYEDNADEFCNAMMVLCDYLKTYGEIIFLILSRDYRQSIEDGFEVTIDRYEFLSLQQRQRIREHFKVYYFEQKCVQFANEQFAKLKLCQQQWEDSKKEIKSDEKQLEAAYQ